MSWVCFDSLMYYTTDVYPLNPPWKIYLRVLIFICENYFLLMITRENLFFLWGFFLSMIICENHFEPFSSVRISSYLCSSARIFLYQWSSVRISFINYTFLMPVLKCNFWGSSFKVHPWDNSFEVYFLREQLI